VPGALPADSAANKGSYTPGPISSGDHILWFLTWAFTNMAPIWKEPALRSDRVARNQRPRSQRACVLQGRIIGVNTEVNYTNTNATQIEPPTQAGVGSPS
jgi:hypothetical protein